MDVSIITNREQWNDFVANQPGGHILQSYEWGELIEHQGGRIYRLGAFEHGRLIGTMMLSVVSVSLTIRLPHLHFTWLYCPRSPLVEHPHSPALKALITCAHEIGRQEQAVVLRLEPNIADDNQDMMLWMSAYQMLGFQTNPLAVHGRRSWVLDLRPDMNQLISHFRKAW